MNSLKKVNILLIFPQGLGDFFFSIKYFISKLKYYKPDVIKNIYLIGQHNEQSELINYYLKDEKIKIYFSYSKVLNFTNILSTLKILIKKFNFCIIEPNINYKKAIILSFLIRAKIKIYKKFKYASFFFDKLIEYDRSRVDDYFLRISEKIFEIHHINFNDSKYNLPNTKKYKIGIAPGSGYEENHKRWKINNWINLINILNQKKNIEFYIYGKEKKIISEIFNNILSINNRIAIYKIEEEKFIDTFNNLRDMNYFISNDNGLACIATLLDIKTYIILGPTYPKPLKKFKNCIFIQSNFICGPCSEWLRYGCGNTLCLEEISPNKVAEKIFF
jgi:ADP-heptose:LPS heptosyltransferase